MNIFYKFDDFETILIFYGKLGNMRNIALHEYML